MRGRLSSFERGDVAKKNQEDSTGTINLKDFSIICKSIHLACLKSLFSNLDTFPLNSMKTSKKEKRMSGIKRFSMKLINALISEIGYF